MIKPGTLYRIVGMQFSDCYFIARDLKVDKEDLMGVEVEAVNLSAGKNYHFGTVKFTTPVEDKIKAGDIVCFHAVYLRRVKEGN